MELITKLWKNFKLQPEIWFFYGFLLTFTLTIRKVLWFFPLRGEFNEYSGVYLYSSDIFLGLTLVAWLFTILYNKIDILSICRNIFFKKTECSTLVSCSEIVPPQKQENCSTWNNFLLRGKCGTMAYILLPLVLVVWSFISLVSAENKIVSIFRSVKILEFYLLYIFVLIRFFCWNANNNVPSQKECSTWNILRDRRGTLLKKIFGLIIIIGLFQAIIGITQFFLQHSLGLFWLKESLISPDIAGVAKIIFNGEAFVRAYGLFPHPNILGGFLIFSIFISMLYKRMFHVEHFAGQVWKNFLLRDKSGTIIFKLILGIQLLALILTFSKSAILGLILGLVYYIYTNVPPQKQENCSTWNNSLLRGRRGTFFSYFRKKKRLIFATGLIIIFALILTKPNLYSFLIKSLNDRSVYVNVSRGTIWDNPVLGIGNGQFVISMQNMPVIKENWMLQPAHNVFLLVWSELGIVGLGLFFGFILYILKNVPPACRQAGVEHSMGQAWNISQNKIETSSEIAKTFGAIFIGLLFIMFFDHYLWDIQQGSFLLWITLGFLVGAMETGDDLTK